MSRVASPPSSTSMLGPGWVPQSRARSVAHQYSCRVSPWGGKGRGGARQRGWRLTTGYVEVLGPPPSLPPPSPSLDGLSKWRGRCHCPRGARVTMRAHLPGEDGSRVAGDGRSGVVLGRENVARAPAHGGAQRGERLDQDGRLDGHVQRAGDERALERLLGAELRAARHKAGHLHLREVDLQPPKVGLREVADLVLAAGRILVDGEGGGHVGE